MIGHVLHPEGYNDLDEIRSYIAEYNPDGADRIVDDTFDAIRALIPFSNQGHKRPALTSRPLRFTLVGEYLIAYAADRKTFVGGRSGARTPKPSHFGGNSKREGVEGHFCPPEASKPA